MLVIVTWSIRAILLLFSQWKLDAKMLKFVVSLVNPESKWQNLGHQGKTACNGKVTRET